MITVFATKLRGSDRARRLIPAALLATAVGVVGTWVVSGVQKARNAARAAATT